MFAVILLILFINISAISAENNDTLHIQKSDSQVSSNTVTVNNLNKNSFSSLSKDIKDANNVLYLNHNYKFDSSVDKSFKKGVTITKSIKIVGNGHSLDGNGQARIIKICSNCNVVLENIVFKNGYINGENGAAVLLGSNAKLTIKNCVFKNNIVYNCNGGAVAGSMNDILVIQKSKFYNNKAIRNSNKIWPKDEKGMGGAIIVNIGSTFKLYDSVFKGNNAYLATILVMSHTDYGGTKTTTAYVKNCLFEKNTAKIHSVFYLDEYGKGTFLNSKFKNNKATRGGTLILDASKALVKNCRFEKNIGNVGGGIAVFKYTYTISKVKIVKCTFINNHAKSSGGAFYSESSHIKILKSKFISNNAASSGGSIFAENSVIRLFNSLMKKNHAYTGGAIFILNKNFMIGAHNKYVKNTANNKKYNNKYCVVSGNPTKLKIRRR